MEKPILFSSPMVQAILDGRKSQTRRIVKIPDLIERPNRFIYKGNSTEFDIPVKAIPYDNRLYHKFELINSNACSWIIHSYKPGDILWVKEMYYAYGMWLKNGHTKSGKQKWRFFDTTQTGIEYHYQENPPENVLPNTKRETYGWFKRSSLFMPFKAHRINLKVTGIRVERLRDITEEDARKEGAQFQKWEGITETTQSYLNGFTSVWLHINGDASWNSNPWVWVIEFKVKEILK